MEAKKTIIEQLTTDIPLGVLRGGLRYGIKEYGYGNLIHVWAENIVDNGVKEENLLNSILGYAKVIDSEDENLHMEVEDKEQNEKIKKEREKERIKIINHRDRIGRTALLKLVMALNVEGIGVLLNLGAKKEPKDEWGRGVEDYVGLWKSYGEGEKRVELEKIREVLGIKKVEDIGHMEALNMSRVCGNKELFNRIYKKRRDYSKKEEKKILLWIVFAGWEDLFKEIIEGKMEGKERYYGELAAYMGANVELEELLMKGGIEKKYFLKYGIAGGNMDLVKETLSEIKGEKVEKYLFTAVKYGRGEVIAELLKEKGIDVNAKDGSSRTALITASENGREMVVAELLKEKGIDSNAKDCFLRTALMHASFQGHEGVVERLLKVEEIDVKAEDGDSKTALMMAFEEDDIEVFDKLLDNTFKAMKNNFKKT